MKLTQHLRFVPTVLLLMSSVTCVALADFSALQPYPEVRYEHQSSLSPTPQQIFVARVDLNDPDVEVRVAPGDTDPDGAGEYQTVLRVPTQIAERERAVANVLGVSIRGSRRIPNIPPPVVATPAVAATTGETKTEK
jgi:hypothetical protein